MRLRCKPPPSASPVKSRSPVQLPLLSTHRFTSRRLVQGRVQGFTVHVHHSLFTVSIDLDLRPGHHLAPLLDLFESVRGAARACRRATPSVCILVHFLLLEDLVHVAVRAIDDRARHVFGPISPCQLVTSQPGTPDSATVRIPGSARMPHDIVTASARKRRPLPGRATCVVAKPPGSVPQQSVKAGAPPCRARASSARLPCNSSRDARSPCPAGPVGDLSRWALPARPAPSFAPAARMDDDHERAARDR